MRDFDALETRASKLKKSEKRKNRVRKIVILSKMGQKRPKTGKRTPPQTSKNSRYFIFEVPARSAFSWFANAHMSDERLP
jgi:hypothetical protein